MGVSGSFSLQHGSADGNYAGVGEQAGIQAGSGGFDVTVKGNTDLKGAVIGSTADASANNLTTGTLTFSDIQDHSHYSASSSGIGGGFSVGTSDKSTGKDSTSGKGGVSPMLGQSEGGDQSATTRSAVATGTITVTNAAGQTQDVAGLSRDTSGTNGSVSKTPDVQKLLSQQADTMNAAQAAGQTIAQAIGDYASSKYKEAVAAKEAAEKAGDSAGIAAAQTAIDEWKEGGDYRVAMHTAGGALIGGLGGNALGGALGAGVSASLAGKLNDLSQSIQKSSPTGNAALDQALGNIIANVAATGAGALVGGSAGAATASNADQFNRQLHPDEKQLIKDKAHELAVSQAKNSGDVASLEQYWSNILTLQADAMVDQKSAQQLDQTLTQLKNSADPSVYQTTVASLSTAKGLLFGMAGQAIPDVNGKPIIADGGALKTFQSTDAQYKDSGLFQTPEATIAALRPAGETPGSARAPWNSYGDSSDLKAFTDALQERASSPNGSVQPAYPIETAVLGNQAGKIVADVISTVVGKLVGAGVTDGVVAGTDVGGASKSTAIDASKPPLSLPAPQPGSVIRNAMTDSELAQAQEIVNLKGGTFQGAPTGNFAGIDGWLNGVPVQLKIVTGQSVSAIQRNIIGAARDMSNAGYSGDVYVDASSTGVAMSKITDFVKPGTPIANVLNEGIVNSVNIKTQDGWLVLTRSTLMSGGG